MASIMIKEEISEQCKAYERFANEQWLGEPFPIMKDRLVKYIKVRSRYSTCLDYIIHLERHPLHGPRWFQEMNHDPDIQTIMKLVSDLWDFPSIKIKTPIIGLLKVPIIENKQVYDSKVKVIEKPGGQKGYMVPDEKEEERAAISETGLITLSFENKETKKESKYVELNKRRSKQDLRELIAHFKIMGTGKNKVYKESSDLISSSQETKAIIKIHNKGKKADYGAVIDPSCLLNEEEHPYSIQGRHFTIQDKEEPTVDERFLPIKLKLQENRKTTIKKSNKNKHLRSERFRHEEEEERTLDMSCYIKAWMEFNSKLLESRLKHVKSKSKKDERLNREY